MKMLRVIALVALSLCAVAQSKSKTSAVHLAKPVTAEPKAAAPVMAAEPVIDFTPEEKFELRTLQAEIFQAQLTAQGMSDALDLARAKKLEADDGIKTAQAALNAKVQAIFKKKGITQQDYAACAGVGQGPCSDVDPKDMALRPLHPPAPKAEPKK